MSDKKNNQALFESLNSVDSEVAGLINNEEKRQSEKIRLIASENYTSRAVRAATGSVFTNKYSEGYPGKRYYEGQQNTDAVEKLAKRRAVELVRRKIRKCSALFPVHPQTLPFISPALIPAIK